MRSPPAFIGMSWEGAETGPVDREGTHWWELGATVAFKIPLMLLCSHICHHDVGLCAQWQPSLPADNDERDLLFSSVPHLLEYLPFYGQGRKEADIFQASKLIGQGGGGCVLKLEPAVLRKYELWTRPEHLWIPVSSLSDYGVLSLSWKKTSLWIPSLGPLWSMYDGPGELRSRRDEGQIWSEWS